MKIIDVFTEHQEKFTSEQKLAFSYVYQVTKVSLDWKEWLLLFCLHTMGGYLVIIIH